MDRKTLISRFIKKLKWVVAILMLNLSAALAYSYFTKDMTLVAISNALTIIGGVYIVLGGGSYLGGMSSEISYNNNFNRNSNQRLADNQQRASFIHNMLIYGIITMLVSFLLIRL